MCCGPEECHRHAARCRELAEKDYAFPPREAFSDLAKRWDLLAAERKHIAVGTGRARAQADDICCDGREPALGEPPSILHL